jgi:hypothetical protein
MNTRTALRLLAFSATFLGAVQCDLGGQTANPNSQPAVASAIDLTTATGYVRAKAQPDECFAGIGQNLPFAHPPCSVGQPKVNQAYVWAMTRAGNNVWFGTVANTVCLVQGTILSIGPISVDTPYETNSWECEFGKSPYVPPLPPGLGDFRPPQMFLYHVPSQTLTEVTPHVPPSLTNPLGIDPLVETTIGIRAAATLSDGHVLLAGPSLTTAALNFFVFDAGTQQYLGSFSLPGYNDIRKFVTYKGDLYTAVGNVSPGGGSVLKWNGSYHATCSYCPSFEVVGQLTGEGAYITVHKGRLFVSTWPNGLDVASLFMSPAIPNGGLTTSQAGDWTKVWSAAMYEPDPAILRSYATGALESFDGHLYWGTMHVPFAGTVTALLAYGPPPSLLDTAALLLGSFRTLAIFRGKDFDTQPHIELLYGQASLPQYQPGTNGSYGTWKLVPNVSHYTPLYGPSGFGNPFNNYTWAMQEWDSRLWVGTMDWSYVFDQTLPLLLQAVGLTAPTITSSTLAQFGATLGLTSILPTYGADLWTFNSSDVPATPESIDGVGNYLNYGVRNMLPFGSGKMFLGMADGDGNLATNPAEKMGGWELIELNPKNQ